MTARLLLVLLAAPLAAPTAARAVPPNRSLALEGSAAARPGWRSPAVVLSAGCWLEGEVEALVRLTLGAAPAPPGRAATGAVLPEVGLRWAADGGRWRPTLAASLGVRLPLAGRATAASAGLQGGLERLLTPGLALSATMGGRWLAGEGAAAEAALGVRSYF